MRRVADQLSEVLERIGPLAPIDVPLLEAHGRVAAEDVVAPWAIPQFDQAIVEGYAVRSEDVADASEAEPVELAVVADAPGDVLAVSALGPGLSARVRAGSVMPGQADAVVPVGDTDAGLVRVTVRAPTQPGANVRRRAEDVDADDIVLRVGAHLGAAQLGLLAAVGKESVSVRPRPRVVVLAVGGELVDPGRAVSAGQVTDSTGALLTAAAREAGAVAYRVGPLPDDEVVVAGTVSDQLVRADLVLISGGLSDTDAVVRSVLPRMGSVSFEEVAVQPGGLQGFGTIGEDEIPVFALPGAPVSAFVAFEVFVRPAIRRMLGMTRVHRPSVSARLLGAIESPAGIRQFARARLSMGDAEPSVQPLAVRDVAHITDLARANALIVVPETTTALAAGNVVDCVVLERRRG